MTTDQPTDLANLGRPIHRDRVLDALEADVRRLTQERDDATRAQDLAENDRATAEAERDDAREQYDQAVTASQGYRADLHRTADALREARSERDDARAALREIVERTRRVAGPGGAPVVQDAHDIARRALGEDT